MGSVVYGFGISIVFKCYKEEGVVVCFSMVLVGIFMVLFGLSLIYVVVYFFG